MSAAHSIRKPVKSSSALARRRRMLLGGVLLALGIVGALAFLLAGCAGGKVNVPLPTTASSPGRRCGAGAAGLGEPVAGDLTQFRENAETTANQKRAANRLPPGTLAPAPML